MRHILKAILTLWYVLLTCVFCFLAASSLLAILSGFGENDGSTVGVGALCVFAFGWGVLRYSKKFIARIEETQKNSDRFKDWDDDE